MSTRSTASRKSQPPLRFPKVERPPVPPAGSSDLPHAAVSLPAGQAAQVIIPSQGEPTLPGSPPPSDEEPQAFPDRRLVATPEEVLQAQVRELDHVLREALDRLADADQRITQLEAESTRFRDDVLPVMESRIAATERLTVTRLANQDPLAATQSGPPLSGEVYDINLPRESVGRKGRRGKGRSSKRGTNNHEMGEHSETSSNTEDDSYSSDEVTQTLGLPSKGKAVPGLTEIIPSRSDYTHLVSYRSYRLVNRSNRYDASVTGKLSSYLKRMKHAIPQDDRFSGDEPIEVLSFLRVFKEAADHNELPEAAAARLITYFLVGIAKEGYRAHLDEAPLCFPTYPYMVQYLLETYAVDDELSRAYMAVTTAKQAENEGEKAFGRRLHRLAIKAGNVVEKRDLTTIYVEGLLPFVQSGLRMHLNPGMSFETVQRHAHNLGVSLRQTIQQSAQTTGPKFPPGVKGLIPRGIPTQSVNSAETEDTEEYPSKGISRQSRYWKPHWLAPKRVIVILPLRARRLGQTFTLGNRPRLDHLPLVWYLYQPEDGQSRQDPFGQSPLLVRVSPNRSYASFAMSRDTISPNAPGCRLCSSERLPPIVRLINVTNVAERRLVMRTPTRAN